MSNVGKNWIKRKVLKMFECLRKFLKGDFVCTKCGNESSSMTFGYGEMICPDCYRGEQTFLFFDQSFVLNRVLDKMVNRK